ncbi:MAG: gamma-butyrobetaine dioxygenase [Pseudomonadota bacterium]
MNPLSQAEILDSGLAVALHWNNGNTARFHAIWLRDNALDAQTRSPQNGQRLISILDVSAQTMIESALISDAGNLEIVFSPDHHQCEFAPDWLVQRVYDETTARPLAWTNNRIERWDEALNGGVPTADFTQCRDDAAALRQWLHSVERYGFAKMTGIPTESGKLCEVAELFGYVRETNYGRFFEVRNEVNPVNLAYTGLGLQAHSDNPYRDPVPTLQLLNCIENSADGGESIVVDSFKAVEILAGESQEYLHVLSHYCARFEYAGSSDVCLQSKRPMIELNADDELIAVRFNNRSIASIVDVPFEQMQTYYAAYRRFAEIITDPSLEVTFKLQPGELFIVDNTRVLHSRTAFSGAGTRWLQGCYADKDGLLSTLRTLENKAEAAA